MKVDQYDVQSFILLPFNEEAMSEIHLYIVLIHKGIKYSFN